MAKSTTSRWQSLKDRVRSLDLYATGGVPRRYHQGMKMFWWDSVLATISSAFVDTYVSLYLLALGATNTQIGGLASASSFLGALTPLPGASLVRKSGKRKSLIVSVSAIFRTFILLAAFVPLFLPGDIAVYTVIALFALRGGLSNLIQPAWVSMTGDVVPIQQRGRYFSTRNTFTALASMAMIPLAGQIIDRIGAPQGYQWSLAIAFAVGLSSSYAYSRIPDNVTAGKEEGSRISFWQALRSNPIFLKFTLIMLLWTFGVQLAGSYFGVFQIQELGSTTRTIGTLATISALSSLVGQRFWGRLIDKRGSPWVIALCGLFIPLVPWIWAIVTRPWHGAFASLSGGFLWAGFNIASFNLLLELPDQKLRTQASASYATVINVASIVAPLAGGLVVDQFGYRWDFALSGLLRLTGGILIMLLLKPFKKQEAGGKKQEARSRKQETKDREPETEETKIADESTELHEQGETTMGEDFWRLNDKQYFEAPGLVVALFHDFYPEGKQGGITLIQHGERVAACGDLRLEPTPGQWRSLPKIDERQVQGNRVIIPAQFEAVGIRYTVRVWPEGESLCVAVDLTEPLPSEWEGKAGFNLELYPGGLFGKTFHLGNTSRIFPQQGNGPVTQDDEGHIVLTPLATGSKLTVAPEDPLRHLAIASLGGELQLYDGRNTASNGWFVVRETVQAGATTDAIRWRITPNSIPGWQRAPVICISQVGYHPDQVKQAILELDPRTETLDTAVLKRIDVDGFTTAHADVPTRWGRWLYHEYAIFDFTAVRRPGMYVVRYGDQTSPPFAIHPDVYRRDVWQPTLETYFPVQMCHVEVRDGSRVWHGACHLDDALQAPTDHVHFDGYHQYPNTETPYAPGKHIPHLDVGGWHDAGDYDLAAGSQARTTHTLCLIRELFGVDTDQTTVNQAARQVLLHTPDGIPDIVEQVAHGALNLLSGYRATAGMLHPHSFHGIIEATLMQYTHLGDAATMTDNRIYDAALTSDQSRIDEAGHTYTGTDDDRWAFTNHDTALEYLVAGTLAAASRVLRSYEDALADECLTTAVNVWDYEQAHDPVEQRAGYVPRGVDTQKVLAAVELLITTGENRYRQSVLELWPTIEQHAARIGGAIARALPAIGDDAFTVKFRTLVESGKAELETELAENPFGVPWHPHVWGVGWQIQSYAVDLYHLWQAFPDLIDREAILRVVNYVLGCHPASNTSLTSGVGAHSLTTAYGTNRHEWSYIPGGMASGVALIRPDFPELKEPWPFLWQQTEYVMPGAADYIFCVLAADAMLNRDA